MEQRTASAIKLWAVVAGVLSLFSLWTLRVYSVTTIEGLLALLGLILGLAVLYVGLRVATLPLKTVSAVFWAKFVVLVLDLLLLLAARHASFITLVVVVVEGVIVSYLIMTVKRLRQA